MVWRTNFDRSLASIRRKKAAKERRAKEAERTIPPAASEEEPRASGAESLRGSTLESSEEEPMLTIPEQHPLHYTGDSEEYDDQISPVTGTRAPEPIPASPSVLQEPPQAAPAAVIHEKSMEEKVGTLTLYLECSSDSELNHIKLRSCVHSDMSWASWTPSQKLFGLWTIAYQA